MDHLGGADQRDIPFGDVFDAGEASSFLIENGYEGTHFQWFEAGRGYVFRESQLRQKFETAGFLAVLSLERHETVDWYLLSDPTGAWADSDNGVCLDQGEGTCLVHFEGTFFTPETVPSWTSPDELLSSTPGLAEFLQEGRFTTNVMYDF